MTTYAIGDVQGCLAPLRKLLAKIDYEPEKDTLWFTGDLVNRGPESLETLRFVKALPDATVVVLGNHDLALLAVSENAIPAQPQDTFQNVLTAPDRTELLSWLRSRPLIHYDPHLNYCLSHAGIYPHWDLKQAILFAQELENVLRGTRYRDFFHHMYGNLPTSWKSSLKDWDRLRFICNAFTRMRFCTPLGSLEFCAKGKITDYPEFLPWFTVPGRLTKNVKLIFGHWAALNGKAEIPNIFPLDTGCVWGNCLTAFCLETQQRITVPCDSKLDN